MEYKAKNKIEEKCIYYAPNVYIYIQVATAGFEVLYIMSQ